MRLARMGWTSKLKARWKKKKPAERQDQSSKGVRSLQRLEKRAKLGKLPRNVSLRFALMQNAPSVQSFIPDAVVRCKFVVLTRCRAATQPAGSEAAPSRCWLDSYATTAVKKKPG